MEITTVHDNTPALAFLKQVLVIRNNYGISIKISVTGLFFFHDRF